MLEDGMVGPNTLRDAILDLVNLILAGRVPTPVRPYFFGGRLFALSNPGGGLRPIAVGMTFRRQAAKIANRTAVSRSKFFFSVMIKKFSFTDHIEIIVSMFIFQMLSL